MKLISMKNWYTVETNGALECPEDAVLIFIQLRVVGYDSEGGGYIIIKHLLGLFGIWMGGF